ncbi:sugar nucleotide-binding protein [Streptomyces sp. NPDC055210]
MAERPPNALPQEPCRDVVIHTSLIVGDGGSHDERAVHELAANEREGILFTDDIYCPLHVADLAAGLWKLAASKEAGVFHLAGTDALSRYSLGVLIARRDGIAPSSLPAGRRADTRLPGALDVRLDSRVTQHRLRSGSTAPGSSSTRGNTRWPTPARSGVTCCKTPSPPSGADGGEGAFMW